MSGVELIAAERQRQVSEEGWTPEHDDAHRRGELARAAICYVHTNGAVLSGVPVEWPWERGWWKPSGDAMRDLVKAGALIAAELDRLERARGGRGATAMNRTAHPLDRTATSASVSERLRLALRRVSGGGW